MSSNTELSFALQPGSSAEWTSRRSPTTEICSALASSPSAPPMPMPRICSLADSLNPDSC
ncbi:hypothetical protein M407DRAFT_103810 [Tulasnella calospora MUT 4182]|uniref:Uncharacterized protein n=1 Tax=Tulasnella calospora MUT 4182 TaxID=1051891 RepID=A0A0C3KRN8_9AGAM|nr:hypothetical protein M407DRAFT_103810 [Tulasnella calospora MUT 4182]